MVVLHVGKRRVDGNKLVDGEQIASCTRTVDALLFDWEISLDQLDPPDEAATSLVDAFGEMLQLHDDPLGVLVVPSSALTQEAESMTYAKLVAKLAPSGRWIKNVAHEVGTTGASVERGEIPLPDVPRSRKVDLFLLSPARAMRELGLKEAPTRVACNDRNTALSPSDVVKFYAPLLKEQGFASKRRVWSDGSAEQLVGHTDANQVTIHAEKAEAGRTFVRLAWIAKPVKHAVGTIVSLVADAGGDTISLAKSATSPDGRETVATVTTGIKVRVVGSHEVDGGEGRSLVRYEVETEYGVKKRGWVHARSVRAG